MRGWRRLPEAATPTKPNARLHLAFGAVALALANLTVSAALAADTADADLIQRGHYLSIAGDCVACHTAPGGKPLAGGLALPTPVGTIVSTNITPSKTAGISSTARHSGRTRAGAQNGTAAPIWFAASRIAAPAIRRATC
jgi:mono/diheme cytochrome c family protein